MDFKNPAIGPIPEAGRREGKTHACVFLPAGWAPICEAPNG